MRARACAYHDEARLPTLEEVADLHEGEHPHLARKDPTATYVLKTPGRERALAVGDVLTIREEFSRILQRETHLRMDDRARFVMVANCLKAHYDQWLGVFGARRMIAEYNADDVIAALGTDPFLVRKSVQIMVSEVVDWLDASVDHLAASQGMPDSTVVDGFGFRTAGGSTLLGLGGLKQDDLTLGDIHSSHEGFIKFGWADHYPARLAAAQAHPLCLDKTTPFEISGGMLLPFFTSKVNGSSIAQIARLGIRPGNLDEFAQKGYIVADPRGYEYPTVKNKYVIMDRRELGFSDIGGLIMLHETKGEAATIGGALNDGIDTLSTMMFDPFFGKLAYYAARYLEARVESALGAQPVTEEEKFAFIYLGARGNIAPVHTSMTLRRINRGDPSPMQAILGGCPEEAEIVFFHPSGIEVQPLDRVYRTITRRLEAYQSL
jgi:hypothetical protein